MVFDFNSNIGLSNVNLGNNFNTQDVVRGNQKTNNLRNEYIDSRTSLAFRAYAMPQIKINEFKNLTDKELLQMLNKLEEDLNEKNFRQLDPKQIVEKMNKRGDILEELIEKRGYQRTPEHKLINPNKSDKLEDLTDEELLQQLKDIDISKDNFINNPELMDEQMAKRSDILEELIEKRGYQMTPEHKLINPNKSDKLEDLTDEELLQQLEDIPSEQMWDGGIMDKMGKIKEELIEKRGYFYSNGNGKHKYLNLEKTDVKVLEEYLNDYSKDPLANKSRIAEIRDTINTRLAEQIVDVENEVVVVTAKDGHKATIMKDPYSNDGAVIITNFDENGVASSDFIHAYPDCVAEYL